jgi:hypothetical protein
VRRHNEGPTALIRPVGPSRSRKPAVPVEPAVVGESTPVSESDSSQNDDQNSLSFYDGGAIGIAQRIAENLEEEIRFRRVMESKSAWVRLGDDVERMTLADAFDLLGTAYAEGAEWVASDGYDAAQWGALLLAVGRDAETCTV